METPPVLESALLAKVAGVRHAFFTRGGGVSAGIYDSLNVGPGSNDGAAAVAENRRRAMTWFGVERTALRTCHQIHSADVVVADLMDDGARPRGDALVATRPGLVCGALSADCAPVLIADGEARVVAAVHAGWRGALAGIVEAAIAAMVRLGASPSRMSAAVGPCIGPASYEVGDDFRARFEAEAAGSAHFFAAAPTHGKHLFDLPSFVLRRLEAAGVEQREWVGHDTCAEADAFFSHRRSVKRQEGDYGRLLSAIMLRA